MSFNRIPTLNALSNMGPDNASALVEVWRRYLTEEREMILTGSVTPTNGTTRRGLLEGNRKRRKRLDQIEAVLKEERCGDEFLVDDEELLVDD